MSQCKVEQFGVTRAVLPQVLRCVVPVVLSNNKNRLNGTYVYRHKHNYIPYSAFTITKVQLHVSAINVGHLQVVHEELINKLYQHVWGVYSLWGGGLRDLCILCIQYNSTLHLVHR